MTQKTLQTQPPSTAATETTFTKDNLDTNQRNSSGKSWRMMVMFSTFLVMATAIYFLSVFQEDLTEMNAQRFESNWGLFFLGIALTLLLFKAGMFLLNLILYIKYKSIESVNDEELPSTTVIVPAYNEGKQVYDTLMSLAKSDYPTEKLQLLAIDDGSKDNTWYWMQEAKRILGDRVTVYQQPKNMGKRHALYRGFNVGTGDVFVTVDSDSIVDADTLRNLVSPFVTNKECGAVAGNIRVLNKTNELIPKMLDVSFTLSFEFVRSGESQLKSVLCTPGALAAYRKTAVMNCLDEWINQTFMGKRSDIGEDRAMTNMILRQGYTVLFQRNAYAYTNVPEQYKQLYKMFIRWGRSNVRESLAMSKYVFTDFRKGSKLGPRLLFTSQFIEIVTAYPFMLGMLFLVASHPILFVSSTLVSILILTSFPVLFYAKRYKSSISFWAYSYSILYTFGLFWITPYAIATASRSGWLTRELPQQA